jgi:hypothetical protein
VGTGIAVAGSSIIVGVGLAVVGGYLIAAGLNLITSYINIRSDTDIPSFNEMFPVNIFPEYHK